MEQSAPNTEREGVEDLFRGPLLLRDMRSDSILKSLEYHSKDFGCFNAGGESLRTLK